MVVTFVVAPSIASKWVIDADDAELSALPTKHNPAAPPSLNYLEALHGRCRSKFLTGGLFFRRNLVKARKRHCHAVLLLRPATLAF